MNILTKLENQIQKIQIVKNYKIKIIIRTQKKTNKLKNQKLMIIILKLKNKKKILSIIQ